MEKKPEAEQKTQPQQPPPAQQQETPPPPPPSKFRARLNSFIYFVFDPSESLYYYWLILVSLAVLYNYLFIIGRASFELLQLYNPLLWIVLDYICDVIYLIDIFVRLRTGYLEQGILLKDCKKLADVYIRSFQFKLDIASIVPFELFAIYFTNSRTILRFNRLLRISRPLECRLKIETRTNYPFLFRIVYLVLLILILIHWNGCFYFLISKKIGIGVDDWVFNNLINDSNVLTYQYISCFLWSTLMLTTIGEVESPDSTFESIIMVITFLFAIVLVATLVGNIGSVISNMKIEQDKFQRRVDAIKSLMKLRRVTKELDRRVVKWFDYLNKNNQTQDEQEILSNLPDRLRVDIASYIHMNTLKNVHIFSDCEEGLLKEIVTKLKVQVYSPGDFVCRKGDIGREMYIIKRGHLNVVSDDGKKVFVTLKPGAFFGEISILNIPGNKTGNRRTANVQSVGYSDLLCLTKNDLWDALVEYPTNKRMIIEKGKEKLRKDNLLDEEIEKKYKPAKLLNDDATLNEDEQAEEFEFIEATNDQKLAKLQTYYETLEKRIDTLIEEFKTSTELVKERIGKVNELYSLKVGIDV